MYASNLCAISSVPFIFFLFFSPTYHVLWMDQKLKNVSTQEQYCCLVFLQNCMWFVHFQPYFQKTKTPQSLLIRLKISHPFPTLQSQQQLKNPWWAVKREKQEKPRSHTLSGQRMAGYHQQEVLWVSKGAVTVITRAYRG